MILEDKFIDYCKEGNVLLVKACLMQGVDVNVDNGYAITCASINGHVEVIKELIKAGADVNASMYNYTEIVKLLKENGAKE